MAACAQSCSAMGQTVGCSLELGHGPDHTQNIGNWQYSWSNATNVGPAELTSKGTYPFGSISLASAVFVPPPGFISVNVKIGGLTVTLNLL